MITTSVSKCCICRLVPSYNKEDDLIQSIRNPFTSFHNKTCYLVHMFFHLLQVTFHHPITVLDNYCLDGCLVSPEHMETIYEPPSSTLQTTRSTFNCLCLVFTADRIYIHRKDFPATSTNGEGDGIHGEKNEGRDGTDGE